MEKLRRDTTEIVSQQLAELETIYATAPVGLCFVDTNLRFVRINEHLAAINGLSVSDHIGRTIGEVLPDLKSELEPLYQQVIQSGMPIVNHKVHGRTPAQPGIERVWLVSYHPLKESGQRVSGVNVMVQEITENQKALEALRESELQYRNLAKNLPALVYRVFPRENNRMFFFNDTVETITGYKLEGLTPGEVCKIDSLILPEDRTRVIATVKDAVARNQPFQFEYRIRDKAGNIRYLWEQGRPVYTFNGQQLQIDGVIFDITSSKQTEQKIREQAALLDVATDAIFVRDLEHRILFWNAGAERLYGWTASEVIGSEATDILSKEIIPKIEEVTLTVINQGTWQGELQMVTKSGLNIIVESHWTLVRDETGQPKSILVVNTDITEKKQLEEQFLRTQRLESLGVLASGIAHDFNNILTPMLIVAQLLSFKFANLDGQDRQLLSILEENAKRGAELVKQILLFGKGVEGKRISLQVKHILQEIEQITKNTFPKSIEIYTNIPTQNLWLISANPTQLNQVLLNLCVNARDAMPNGGLLSLEAENCCIDDNYATMNPEAKAGSYVVITVSDTGCGMPQEQLKRIFEPFFTTKEVGKGTGLGLSTVKGIVKNHGGFVEVYSEVGQGSQFKVYFPATDGEVIEDISDAGISRGNGELILIADDEVSVLETTKKLVEQYNYNILMAHNGIEAISLYAQHGDEISLVLMDLQMPLMDGFNAMRVLQTMNPSIKIIANSGVLSELQLLEVGDIGIKAFLPKPYTVMQLLKTIKNVLST
ncbi:PAS domain S-box protein [Scytonema sp. UIC 10036]|uniref:hybrid sensor histidine kinase/response regulator n=1 Tax=Scytonema sp. UIC 10036 TaxID=2304196 RepID=UPI0012DA94C1|nr:PAS domain S-box protein [Scytonema sp. UIC 10036]MUG99588.1 PAS domain S-box protein [Scytonema sp. UIC 10036]